MAIDLSEKEPVTALSEPNLQEIHDVLIAIAHEAGDMIVAANPSTVTSGIKKNSADLVTETDRAVELMVYTRLRSRYPEYDFLGEETYKANTPLTTRPTFVVDPIDGTVNFVHGHPHVCVSLGFCVDERPAVGVVYNPFTRTLYSGVRGRGSFLNGTTPLPLRRGREPLRGLQGALVAVEWGSDRVARNFDVKARTFRSLAAAKEDRGAMVHSLRSHGSAALNFCAVASGALDVYWEAGCWAWDVAAGWLILEEAGGIVADARPGRWAPRVDGRSYLAVRPSAAGEGQREIVEEVWSHVAGDVEYSL
ncbi:MAG: hypothetical protein M1825_000759 [Sarcosagium campestre]|nr:MAG: hypothetical protein M1825_000759 [Sarcosagium campestre]